MPLEDFFTLTEMKDGLSTPGRVEELVSMMQKQRESVLNSVGDATRQWSAIAHILAATENKDCLNHFVMLKGQCYLKQCLQEAQNCTNNVSDNVLEGLITSLLAAFEKLPIDRDMLAVSGIGVTVEDLLGHKNINIKEKAKKLSDKWNSMRVNVASCQNLEDKGTCSSDHPKLPADANPLPGKVGTGEASCEVESVGTESQRSNARRCSDSFQMVDSAQDVKMSVTDQLRRTPSLNSAGADVALGDSNSLASSLVSNSCPENLSVTDESSVCPAVGSDSAVTCSTPVCNGKDINGQQDVSVLKETFDGGEGMEVDVSTKEGGPYKLGRKESCNLSSSSGLSASLPVQKAAMEPTVSCDLDSKGGESCVSNSTETHAKSGAVDCGMPKCLRTTKELKPVAHATMIFQDIPGNGRREMDNPEAYQRNEAVGSVGDVEEGSREADLNVSKGVDIVLPSDTSKSGGTKAMGLMDQKSALGLEYEEIDALEVARQVAIEVEREVVDYREPFCSSPEVNSGETTGTCSPDVEGEQDQPEIKEVDGNRSPARKELSDDASSPKEHQSRISDDIGTDREDQEHILESPKVASIAQGSVSKFDKTKCDFDLNEDILTEEFGGSMNPIPAIPVNLSAPRAVVATSKGAPSLPITPLHFEGEMGWKGSAATSAFRPASPRRTPDCEKSYSGQRQKPNFLEIDLNVAEGEYDMAADRTPVKQMLVSSGLPSGDSSMEVSSRRAERLKLDLNRLGDEDTSMIPSPSRRFHHQNGDQNLSSASSSSSRQPSMRDFDLNDDPCFSGGGGLHNISISTSKTSAAYGSSKVDAHVIKIMGSRMSVERKDYVNQAHLSYPGNGLHMEAMMATRLPLPYAHMPPPFGYSGHPVGPTMPFPPALYGHGGIPYMVDSRGATIIPQVLGSAGPNSAPSLRQHFLTSGTGPAPSTNRVEPSRSGWDLNSGMTTMESGVRDAGGFKQLFKHGNNGVVEEQTRNSSQPSSSGMGMKRKEPDCGWEPYAALGYNR